ncbi:MAG: DNA replication and repair protein RecF, partial [Eubacteriales bacterium]|nr:DNA replication and repair protein RecF [Eubacteriales bacterium]
LSGIDVRTFGSQGQKRTAALSLKLSELAFIREIKEEAPVLILDDVLSELDEGRQQLLMESMKDCQCFLTCTSLEGLKRAGLGNMKVFRCKGGEMRPE